MRKYIFVVLLIFPGAPAFSQEIIISGTDKNRLLTWDDFKGQPDKSSSHDAYTYWTVNYTMQGIFFKGDTAKIGSFSVRLELNENRSWVKPEKQTAWLLKHEQGHFDLGLLCQRELIKQLNSTVFFKSGFQDKIQSIFTAILEKYQSLGTTYDGETNHSMNRDAQDNWNHFFAKELNK